jgi:hypothetical protein
VTHYPHLVRWARALACCPRALASAARARASAAFALASAACNFSSFFFASSRSRVRKSVELAEVDWFDEVVTYDDYLADFGGVFHDLRDDLHFADCLAPDSYVASQGLAERLLEAGSLGVVYASVRRRGGRESCDEFL